MEREGRSLGWVLARLRLRLDAMPCWGSELAITTWPSDVDRLYAYRDFELKQEGGPVGAAVTHWLLIDLDTRKPVRIPERVSRIELPERERALPEADRRPAAPDAPTLAETFSAHRFLIDVNQHVNSAVYLDWAVETIPEEVWTSHRLSELDVLFRAEATKGDRIEARSEELVEAEGGVVFEHRVCKEDGETELIRGRSRWAPDGAESDPT
jgi:acyl-ACP thioesterase